VVGSLGDLKPAATAYLTWKDLPAGRYGYVSTSGDDPPNDDDSKGLHGEFNIS
jgi:hypothetical protein